MKWIFFIVFLCFYLVGKSQDSTSVKFQKTIDSLRAVIISDTDKYSLSKEYKTPIFFIQGYERKKGFNYIYGLHIPGQLAKEFINEFLNDSMGAKISSITKSTPATTVAIFGPEGRYYSYIFVFVLKKKVRVNPYIAGLVVSGRIKKIKYGDNWAIQKSYLPPGRMM